MADIAAKDLYFVHIPKNAGTSIEEVGLDYSLKWGKEFYNRKVDKSLRGGKVKTLAPWHFPYSIRPYPNSADKCFCVVRNPYTRIISDFNYFSARQPQIEKIGLNSFIEIAILTSFQDDLVFDNHPRPQSHFVFHKGRRVVDHVLKFENIEKEFKDLTGLELSKKSNASIGNKLTIKDISERNIHLINYFYYEDFENFEYERIIKPQS